MRGELDIGARARRHRSLPPRVVPAGGDTQDPAHGGNTVDGLVGGHELESLDGLEVVSRANQAAAFDRIARSSRSCRTSRRSRRTSSCSSVVSPSVRSPASSAACFTQFRIACAEGSNWRASSSGVRPLRTSSTIRCRNSGEYDGWLFGIVDLPFRPNDGGSTKPGQLHFQSSRPTFGASAKERRADPVPPRILSGGTTSRNSYTSAAESSSRKKFSIILIPLSAISNIWTGKT